MKAKITLFISLIILGGSIFSQNQFENGGFEEWEEVGLGPDLMEPVDWSSVKTSDQSSLNNAAPVIWGISDDAHSGNHSLHLFNVSVFGIVATGTITNGRVHADFVPDNAWIYTDASDPQWFSVCNWRPDSVVGYYKCNPVSGDFPTVKVALHTGELHLPGEETNIVAVAYKELPSVVQTTWKRFSVPFEYFQSITPEYQLTILTAGDGTNAQGDSEVWFDDLKFVYLPNDVAENKFDNISIIANNNSITISPKNQDNLTYKVFVHDIMGREIVGSEKLNGISTIDFNENILSGVYIVTLVSGSEKFSTKIIIN